MFTNVSGSDDGGSMTSETLLNIDQTTQRNNPIYEYLLKHKNFEVHSMTNEN
jgi:hypothetical protein